MAKSRLQALSVDLFGADALVQTLEQVKLGVRNRVIRRAVTLAARELVPPVRAATPKRRLKRGASKGKNPPGTLRKSTGVVFRENKDFGTKSAYIGHRWPKGAGAHLQEYGTKQRKTKKGANRGANPKKPFFTPVIKRNKLRVYTVLRTLLTTGLADEMRKYAKKGKTVFK